MHSYGLSSLCILEDDVCALELLDFFLSDHQIIRLSEGEKKIFLYTQ